MAVDKALLGLDTAAMALEGYSGKKAAARDKSMQVQAGNSTWRRG
jgi:hypothetical protein